MKLKLWLSLICFLEAASPISSVLAASLPCETKHRLNFNGDRVDEAKSQEVCLLARGRRMNIEIYSDISLPDSTSSPEELAENLLTKIEARWLVYERVNGLVPDKKKTSRETSDKISLIFDQFEGVEKESPSSGQLGFFLPDILGENVILLNHPELWLKPNEALDSTELQLLSHELTHVFHYLWRPNDELWMKEGLAELISFEAVSSGKKNFWEIHGRRNAEDTLIELKSSGPFHSVDYEISGLFFLYLFDNYGGPYFIRSFLMSKDKSSDAIAEAANKMKRAKNNDLKSLFSDFRSALLYNRPPRAFRSAKGSWTESLPVNP